ncbi:hypothetical protein GDO86_003533 [Hymenochirus boettgeri]|uniref:EH domain-containing protein n=1 Tax=Hymenochirus boettgeri TaxID=247094 RepID=A0A8T2K6T3_9PIPI|nr:hypothetical protein GDO86_003533 [Hymenochirus boettgeri]
MRSLRRFPRGCRTVVEGGMPIGPMQGTATSFMGQSSFLGMHRPAPQFSLEMQKQFAEEQKKRFEQQQKMLEEERKRRQFEEQKQKLKMLSSVKVKTGEKSRDDALEAIKGNLDFFSRDAKMHPTPVLHTKTTGGIFQAPNTLKPILPPWISNDKLVPDFYKNILETTMTATGIDTTKLYPILMSSGLPREALGQIWALANRTVPGKLAKEELYTVLAMIAVAQRGGPAVSLDVLSQIPSAPLPVLTGFPVALPPPQNQLHMMSPAPVLSISTKPQPSVMSTAPHVETNVLNTFMPSFPSPKLGEGFADFKSSNVEGLPEFKTSDAISTLELSSTKATFLTPSPIIPVTNTSRGHFKPLVNVSEIDPFSPTVVSGTFNPLPMPISNPSVKLAASHVHPVSNVPLPALTTEMSSSLSNEFGDFALYDTSTGAASAGSQNDFADFMAFNSDTGNLEQDFEDKFKTFNLEQSISAIQTPNIAQTKLHTTPSSNIYDIPKPFGLENPKDSASIKSLDLPSIGGSSFGKEDSEDALSVNFDVKLSDMEGNMKHGFSDGYLDLQTVGGQQFTSSDVDDFKGVNSNLENIDWLEKDIVLTQPRKQSEFITGSDNSGSFDSALQERGSSFGSNASTLSKINVFSSDSSFQEAKHSSGVKKSTEELNEDFFGLKIEDVSAVIPDSDSRNYENSSMCMATEDKNANDFGEFQREKPKISKFDFLIATSQGKVKSSEEMIKNELATFDLCAQGELGYGCLIKLRDRSNTLSEKPCLPVIRDKYKDLQGSERYVYEWQRCLESALQIIAKANDTLNGISSSSVCTEVIQSAQGMEYLLGVVEVYRVTKRVELGIKATAVCSEKLQLLLKEIDKLWNNLIGFMSLASLMPDESALDFSSCMLRPGIKNAQELACGVCLLNVDSRSKAFNSKNDNLKLCYGGHQYHASCANFWINCVQPKPPGLLLPDLL